MDTRGKLMDIRRAKMITVNGVHNIEQKTDYQIKQNKVATMNSESFSTYLNKARSLDDIFEEAAEKYNVSVDLLKAIGKAESNFNPKAVSRAGAQGVMQLMPATAASLGVKDSFDPEQNIMGGAKYIADLLKRYDGDTKLALAAYNAGMGNVAKYGGIPPFKETQNYVVKVLGFMKEDINTGVKVPTHKGMSSSESVPLSNPTSLPWLSSDLLTRSTTVSIMEEIFSEQDYLRFLDIFLEDKNEDGKEEKDKSI